MIQQEIKYYVERALNEEKGRCNMSESVYLSTRGHIFRCIDTMHQQDLLHHDLTLGVLLKMQMIIAADCLVKDDVQPIWRKAAVYTALATKESYKFIYDRIQSFYLSLTALETTGKSDIKPKLLQQMGFSENFVSRFPFNENVAAAYFIFKQEPLVLFKLHT